MGTGGFTANPNQPIPTTMTGGCAFALDCAMSASIALSLIVDLQ